MHPLKSIGCFIKKPISTEQLVIRVKEELEKIIRIDNLTKK